MAQPGWLPQIEAIQSRFGHLFADLTIASDDEAEAPAFNEVVGSSTDVLAVGTQILATQQVTPQQLNLVVAAIERMTAAQEKMAVAQERNNELLAQINQNTTASPAQQRREILNARIGIAALIVSILGLLLAGLVYVESEAPTTNQRLPTPTERPTEEPLSLQMVQVALLPHMLELLQQVSPPRIIARTARVKRWPRRHSPVELRLPLNSEIRLLYTWGRWACVIYRTNDSATGQGWLLKKYLKPASAKQPAQSRVRRH